MGPLTTGKPDTGTPDGLLVKAALAGDETAFEQLILRYQSLVHLVAYRQCGSEGETDDIAQETFVRAFQHLGDLDDPDRFKGWLLRIAANIALDHVRRKKPPAVSLEEKLAGPEALGEEAPARDATGEETLDRRELRLKIVEAIYSLPHDYQVPVAMRYLEEIPYREISRRLGLREDTLRKRIHRANLMLRRKLKNLWPGDDAP
ncbi:MAG: sigma-70 family RNA polymerase sigma factor [Planctomycetota bacterium]|nr:sigma-70 family RNA polymerase sigma factor [Planctomycetota bacterium]